MLETLTSPSEGRGYSGSPFWPDTMSAAMGAVLWSARAYRGDALSRRLQRQVRAAFAATLRPSASRHWFTLMEDPAMRPFAQANPLLPLKPFRVYLSANWNRDRRRKVIRDTYSVVLRRGGALRQALLDPDGAVLARMVTENAGEVAIRLHQDARFRKEGEFTLSLDCPALGGRVMSLAFSLERLRSGHLAAFIGCVQGQEDGADAIRTLTKALHGLRPRSLMVPLIQDIAAALGVQELYGAGLSIQVHRRKHAIHLPGIHALGFDYDAYWLQAGGAEGFDGWFRLPLQTPRRGRDDMKPNKRSMYAKRYAMLDELGAAIRKTV